MRIKCALNIHNTNVLHNKSLKGNPGKGKYATETRNTTASSPTFWPHAMQVIIKKGRATRKNPTTSNTPTQGKTKGEYRSQIIDNYKGIKRETLTVSGAYAVVTSPPESLA